MKTKVKFALLCAVGVSAAACTTDRRDFEGLSVSSKNQSRPTAAVRYLSACPTDMTEPIAEIVPAREPDRAKSRGVGGAAVAIGVDFAVEAVSIGLKRAQTNLNGHFLASGAHVGGPEQVRLATRNATDGDGCIVIYHGPSGASTQSTIGEGLSVDVVRSLGLSDQPAFYLELKASSDTGARVLRMNHLQYADTSALNRGNGRKTVTVALGFGAPKKSANDPATGVEVYLFNLGRLQVGSSYVADPTLVAVSEKTAKGAFNMVAKVSESQDPSIALEAMSTAFENNKSDLAKALKEAIN